MELGKVFVDSVIVGPRHRALDPSRLEALAESMDLLGLQQPISVYLGADDSAHLIAGLHRLEAARKLRWEQIDASIVALSPVRREMWEIAENLFRVDLTKDQRDEHIRRYAELIEAAEAEGVSQQDAPKLSARGRVNEGRPKGTARKIAEETGISVDTVRRALNPQQPTDNTNKIKLDADIRQRAARSLAEMTVEFVPADALDHWRANFGVTTTKDYLTELANLTGQSIMDRTAA